MFVIAEAIIERRAGAFEPAGPSTAFAFNVHPSVVMPLLESPVTLIEAFDGHRWDSPQKLGSHRTHRWRRESGANSSLKAPKFPGNRDISRELIRIGHRR